MIQQVMRIPYETLGAVLRAAGGQHVSLEEHCDYISVLDPAEIFNNQDLLISIFIADIQSVIYLI